jgi:heat shock protein HslJ
VVAGLFAVGLVAAACGSSVNRPAVSSTTPGPALEGTSWQLTATTPLGTDLGQVTVTALFDQGVVRGEGGCNTYNGPYTVSGSKLTIGPNLATTQKACPAAPTAIETAYLGRLVKVASYSVAGDTLTLSDSGGQALLSYQAINAAQAIIGSWTVTGYYTGTAISSVVGGADLTAVFTEKDVSGNSGCNTFNGPYTVTGGDGI